MIAFDSEGNQLKVGDQIRRNVGGNEYVRRGDCYFIESIGDGEGHSYLKLKDIEGGWMGECFDLVSRVQTIDEKIANALELIRLELARATEKHPGKFNSAHEGFAVLKEEVDELWDEVRANNRELQIAEVTQVGAMALRYILGSRMIELIKETL
jgi:hypothetical protein